MSKKIPNKVTGVGFYTPMDIAPGEYSKPTPIAAELEKIIDSHTQELKAGHNHLIVEQILALIKQTLDDCLPEKKLYEEDYPDDEYFADNEYLAWNKAIDQTRANFKKKLGL